MSKNYLDKDGLSYFWGKVNTKLGTKANTSDLATVATSGSYNDLTDKSNSKIFYGTCATTKATQTKVVVCDSFTSSDLVEGVCVRVKFTYANTYNGTAKLNINSTGVKDIYYIDSGANSRYFWNAGEVIDFVYDGTKFVMVRSGIANTSYYGLTKLQQTATSTSSTSALTPASLNAIAQHMISGAEVYSASNTYNVGDLVRYSYSTYKCTTDIPTAEAWNAEHWEELPALQTQVDLKANASDIPTATSDLTNDSGFITKAVNDLTNYYTTSNTYTKTEVNNLIAQINQFKIEVVQTLPTQDIDTHTIYFVAKTGTTGDVYNEYIYINNTWELIGNTQVDLTNYYTKTETDTLLGGKQDTLVSGTNIKTINGTSIVGSGDLTIEGTPEVAISTTQPVNPTKIWINPNEVITGSGFELNKIYPIGSLYFNTTGVNPSTFLGGTWQSFGAGKVLVGQDTNDTDFDTLLETGGSKYLQAHQHMKTTNLYKYEFSQGIEGEVYKDGNAREQMTDYSGDVVGVQTGNSGNLQPYIVVSIWVRTA